MGGLIQEAVLSYLMGKRIRKKFQRDVVSLRSEGNMSKAVAETVPESARMRKGLFWHGKPLLSFISHLLRLKMSQ